jgi:hypothetical protein
MTLRAEGSGIDFLVAALAVLATIATMGAPATSR